MDRLLADGQAAALLADFRDRAWWKRCGGRGGDEWRAGDSAPVDGREWLEEGQATLWQRAEQRLRAQEEPSLRAAINATGVVLHTGLGRAVLPAQPSRRWPRWRRHTRCWRSIDESGGERGSRQEHVRGLLRRLTGVRGRARGQQQRGGRAPLPSRRWRRGAEVVIARGQLVEIGGSFRIPDVIRQSGARLVEVGATNKSAPRPTTRRAITEETALLLRVHPSNFQIVGFTEEVPLPALVELGREHGIPVDGRPGQRARSIDLRRSAWRREPTVQESVRGGRRRDHLQRRQAARRSAGGLILGVGHCLDA